MDATFVSPGEGRSLWVLGELVTYMVTSDQTGGAYSLFKVTTQPGGDVLPHVQHREDEAFYVLDGEYEFLVEGRTIRAGASYLLYVPKGTLHAHKNVGKGVGRMLVSQTPGGLYEHFIEEVGEEAPSKVVVPSVRKVSPEAARRIVPAAARHGIEIALPRELRRGHLAP
jgi:mannose-6-phosphate isomerase-like protein (cupin superfamily)